MKGKFWLRPGCSAWPADHEKAPTSPFYKLRYRGVEIYSRYCKGHEFNAMLIMLETYSPKKDLRFVRDLWCDSKAGSCYVVTVKDLVSQGFAEMLAKRFNEAIRSVGGGHNGIHIHCDGILEDLAIADPDWGEINDRGGNAGSTSGPCPARGGGPDRNSRPDDQG